MRNIFFLLLFFNILVSNEITILNHSEIFSLKQQQFIKDHPTIKVSNEKNWAPYDYNENGIARGYSIEYLNLIAKKIGVTFVYTTDKWSNLVKKIQNKELDLIHPLSINKDRKKFLHFTNVLFNNDISIVTNDMNNNIKSLKDLDGKVLSVAKGWNITRILKKDYPNVIFKEYDSALDKLKAVAFGEADATIDDYLTINFLKQKHLLNNLKIVGRVKLLNLNTQLHMGVRKDWEIFKDILNIAMYNISNDEKIALNKKWMIPNTKNISFSQDELNFLKNKKKITMCIDPNWMPYEKLENNQHHGMISDYFKIFQKLLPIPIQLIQTSSWNQTIEYSKANKCDIISSAVQTPNRLKYLSFSNPFVKLPLVVATKSDKPFIANIQDILPYKIAIVKNYAYVEIFKEKYPNIQIVEVASINIGFEKVLKDEVFGYVDSLAAIGNKIQEEYLGNIKIAGKLDQEFTLRVASQKHLPQLTAIFNKAIQTLDINDHSRILNKWVSVKYDNVMDYSYMWKVLVFISLISIFFLYRQHMLKKQNQALKESVDEFEHLINSTMEAIFISNKGECIDSNLEALQLFGYANKQEVIGLQALEFIDPRCHDLVKENLRKEQSNAYEVNAVKKDGTIFPVLIKGHNFIRKHKKIRITAMLDLTQLKQNERHISENAKMAALGEMIGNIAHQWRQPLSVISTAASGVKVQKEMNILKDEVFYDSMDGIVKNAQYLSKTIDDFKSFIKEDKQETLFNLDKNIDKNLTILTGMFKINNIEIILDTDNTIELNTFENELTQAFINIINNAKDILNEKNISDKYIFITTYKLKDKVCLSIKDNAGGISPSIINRIFEPYFTTKDKRQGTGLGLYMVRQIIVESMKCKIDVKNVEYEYINKKYKGAEFIITL